MGHTYRGTKSGCKLPTLFGSDCDDGLNAGIWVIHTGDRSGCKLPTLFGSDCDDDECWYMGHTYR